jgi:uncharacterized protein YdiU (UPF0061 family)
MTTEKNSNQKNSDKVAWYFDNTYSRLPEILFTRIKPITVSAPKIVVFNHELARLLGLNFTSWPEDAIAELFSGNNLPFGAEPIAQAYAGHQYGHFTFLGDGRAVLLGEHLTFDHARFDIQLKGSGRTPYSRQGDGRAALAPMLREYIISEAMVALGIPTTRSLGVIATGDVVYRATKEPGAVLARIAASHIRVGTFEYLRARQDDMTLKILIDYTINRHYPSIQNSANPTLEFLKLVVSKQIDLIVEWMRVGFIHGVMNTDNMTISGETIDYGPCAFMDEYDPNTVFSFIDAQGRYNYQNQPKILQWNLARFAECLLPFLHEDANQAVVLVTEIINSVEPLYQQRWLNMMRKKFGCHDAMTNDENLIQDFLEWMHTNKLDYTNTFLALSHNNLNDKAFKTTEFKNWHLRWQTRVKLDNRSEHDASILMQANNPAIIPRNHHVAAILDSVVNNNDMTEFNKFLAVLTNPYCNTVATQFYQTPPTPDEKIQNTFCGT